MPHPVAIAQPAVPHGHADAQFARDGRPEACPWRPALVALLRFSEALSDRRTTDAGHVRIDGKHLLGLP